MTNTDCQNIFAVLSQYLDEELPPQTCEEIERHIQGCAPCVEFVESLKKSIALGRGYRPNVEIPELSEQTKAALRTAFQTSVSK